MAPIPPVWIRYFAQTDQSELGLAALEYCRSMVRVAPVRIIPFNVGVPLDGPWEPFAELMTTPMVGPFVNVVCVHRVRWSWEQHVAAAKADPNVAGMVASGYVTQGATDRITDRVELYTKGVRNVLLMTMAPSDAFEWNTAVKYEAVIASSAELGAFWNERQPERQCLVVPVPVTDHAAIRAAVLGG